MIVNLSQTYLSDDTILTEVVYYYSQTEGIKMECLSSYYAMALYEDSVYATEPMELEWTPLIH